MRGFREGCASPVQGDAEAGGGEQGEVRATVADSRGPARPDAMIGTGHQREVALVEVVDATATSPVSAPPDATSRGPQWLANPKLLSR